MIGFANPRLQNQNLRAELEEAIGRVFDSGQFILGEHVAAFERDFATCCGVQQAIAVNSGTSALHLALLAAGVGPGDEVITTAFTFIATVAAIDYIQAVPVLVDIDPATFTIDPCQIESAITSKTRAIIPVHLYGHPADMDAIMDIARRHGLTVIEDAAQAHGARYRSRLAASSSKPEWGVFPAPPHDDYPWVADPAHTMDRLGWKPRISLEEGLKRTIDAMR